MESEASLGGDGSGRLTKAEADEAMAVLVSERIARSMMAFRTGLPSGLISMPEPREAELRALEKLQRHILAESRAMASDPVSSET